MKATGGSWDPAVRPLYFVAGGAGGTRGKEFRWPDRVLLAVNDMPTRASEELLQDHLDKGRLILLDSGVFWLTNRHKRAHKITMDEALQLAPEDIDGFAELEARYIDIVSRYHDRLWGYIELDQGGAVNKRRTRGRLESLGLTPMPVYHPLLDGWCVDTETEILTARGWLRYNEVQAGDIALTLDHRSGLSQWQEVQAVNAFIARDRPMRLMEGRLHSSLTTLNHSWPVLTRARFGPPAREMVTTAELRPRHGLVTAAPCADLPAEAKYSDAFVELVAWFFTEGSIGGHPYRRSSIAQSYEVNPSFEARIRRCLTAMLGPAQADIRAAGRAGRPAWRERTTGGGMTVFALNGLATALLESVAPDRVVSAGFVMALTQAQLELFLATAVDADGWRHKQTEAVNQSNPDRLEPVMLAAILAGRSPHLYAKSPRSWQLHLRQASTTYPADAAARKWDRALRIEDVPYSGIVWCPTLPNRTWLARRRGTVYFTGNSYFDELAGGYDRICFGNVVQASGAARVRLLQAMYERHRAYPGCWIHILGLTVNKWCLASPPDSCDSSTWISPLRWLKARTETAMLQRVGTLPAGFTYKVGDPYERGSTWELSFGLCADAAQATALSWQHATARLGQLSGQPAYPGYLDAEPPLCPPK